MTLAELPVPKAEPLPQDSSSTTPEAEVKPVHDKTDQPFVPGASLITPVGVCTVTEQFGYPVTAIVRVPPGQYWSPAVSPEGLPVTWKVN